MKAKILMAILIGSMVFFSTNAFAASAREDLDGVIEDPAYFDGGPGSTLNE